MVILGGYHEVIRVIGMYSLVVLLLGGGLVSWAFYNIIRFGGVERRVRDLPVTPAQFGRDFGQNPELVALWQKGKILYVTHDTDGHITNVEIVPDSMIVPHSDTSTRSA